MILVTGADGIVGRAVCSALRLAGKEFIPVVRHKQAITAENALVTDLVQPCFLANLARSKISAIVHLAAAVPHSVHYPDTELTADLTIRMDNNIRSLQEQLGVHLLYMSTCGLYDRLLDVVKHEDDESVIRIESPYFAAKMAGEKLFKNNPLSTILRLAAPVGPGLKPSVVVSRFIMTACSGDPIQIWGSGSREQNFIDVRDVAALIMKVIADPQQCTVNVANVSSTMVELAKTVINVVGKGSFEYSDHDDPRDGETAKYSISKAHSLYSWTPKHDLADSCYLLFKEEFEKNS